MLNEHLDPLQQVVVQREFANVCWASDLKIHFNGIGGLLTYISATPTADVAA